MYLGTVLNYFLEVLRCIFLILLYLIAVHHTAFVPYQNKQQFQLWTSQFWNTLSKLIASTLAFMSTNWWKFMFPKFNKDNETYHLLLLCSEIFHLQAWLFHQKIRKADDAKFYSYFCELNCSLVCLATQNKTYTTTVQAFSFFLLYTTVLCKVHWWWKGFHFSS